MKTAKDLVEYCVRQVNRKTVYMWGSFGHNVNQAFINRISQQYPEWYTDKRVDHFESLIGKGYRAFDCVGLIKSFLWGDYKQGQTKGYNAAQDISANAMYARSNVKGDVKYIPERAGLLVWMDGHIGVYVGGGNVVECTPKWTDGVQLRKLSDRKWLKWCECPYIEYETEVKQMKETRYNLWSDIPDHYKSELEPLVKCGALRGKSGTGDNMVVDLTEDAVRTMIVIKRYVDKKEVK